MTGPGGWFIDEDLLGLAHVLAAARRPLADVHYPGDGHEGCPTPGTYDEVWAAMITGRDWAVLRKDNRSAKRRRPVEYEAFTQAGLGVFVLRAKNATRFDQVRIVLARWDELTAFWDQHDRPFFARFGKTVKPYDISVGFG